MPETVQTQRETISGKSRVKIKKWKVRGNYQCKNDVNITHPFQLVDGVVIWASLH